MPTDMYNILPGNVTLRQKLDPHEVWYFSECCPLSYSDVTRHIQDLPTFCKYVHPLNLGETPEKRPLLAARITDLSVPTEEKGRVLILAGQHGTEFAGMFAAKGALDFLVSRLPYAATLRRRYIFDVIPCANPDGNAHGMGCFNSEGIDQLEAFEGVQEGLSPGSAEALLIWQHLAENPPDIIFNFHAYAHPRPFGDPPYEGMYLPDPDRLSSPERRDLQHVLNHTLFYFTDAGSQHRRPCPLPDKTLEYAAVTA